MSKGKSLQGQVCKKGGSPQQINLSNTLQVVHKRRQCKDHKSGVTAWDTICNKKVEVVMAQCLDDKI